MKNLRNLKDKKQEKVILENYKGGVVAEQWLANIKNCQQLSEELHLFLEYSKLVSPTVTELTEYLKFNLQKSIIEQKSDKILENLNALTSLFFSLAGGVAPPTITLCEATVAKKITSILESLSLDERKKLAELRPEMPRFFLSENLMDTLILETINLNEETNIAELQKMIQGLSKLETLVKNLPGFEQTKAELAKFKSSIQNTASSRLGFAFSEETQIARISLVMEMFAKFVEAWPTVRELFKKELESVSPTAIQGPGQNNNSITQGGFAAQEAEQEKQDKIKEITKKATSALIKTIKGSWYTQMSKLWRAAKRGSFSNVLKVTYPGKLNPETLMSDLVAVLVKPSTPTVVNKQPRITEAKIILETLQDLDNALATFTGAIKSMNAEMDRAAAAAAQATIANDQTQQQPDPNTSSAQSNASVTQQTATTQTTPQQTVTQTIPDLQQNDQVALALNLLKKFREGDLNAIQLKTAVNNLNF